MNNEITTRTTSARNDASCKCAFTLAEVLITLGIIGIVAAMTMPTLIANHQKKQTVTQLKKAYSELSQALKMAEIENGTMETWDMSGYDDSVKQNLDFFNQYLKPYLSLVRVCEASDRTSCFPTTSSWNNVTYREGGAHALSFVTKAGYSVLTWVHGTGTGGHFIVDLNGTSKPNIVGKDIFRFIFTFKDEETVDIHGSGHEAGLRAFGLTNNVDRDAIIHNEEMGCSRDVTNFRVGAYCAALIQYDGWEIKDDYPW